MSSCPDREQLGALGRGELDVQTATVLEEHISKCSTCSEIIETYQDVEVSPEIDRMTGETGQIQLDAIPPLVPSIVLPEKTSPVRELSIANTARMEQVGPYRIIEEIGRGGMGAVYKAVHIKLDKPVALKVLPEDRLQHEPFVQRFNREMKALGRLDHANIVRATDAGEADGIHYLAMELVDGLDLSTLSKRVGPVAPANACELIRQAAVGLEYAHEAGRVHRDIKPSNLMVTPSGEVKILDLGLALFAEATDELTGTGHTMGTVDYMAPEQADDSSRVDDRADVYSLGCTLYRLLSGSTPFANKGQATRLQIMMAHTRAPIPSIHECQPDVPVELDSLLVQMLDKDPKNRPAAGEVAIRLGPFAQDSMVQQLVESSESGENRALETERSRRTHPHLSSAMTGTQPSIASEPAPRRKTKRTGSFVALVIGLIAVATTVAMGPSIYRIVTNRGLLVVDVDESIESKVTIEILGPEEVTLNERNGFSINLKAGQYEIRTGSGVNDRFVVEPDRIRVTRGGTKVLQIRILRGVPLASEAAKPLVHSPPGSWIPGPTPDRLPGMVPSPTIIPGVSRWQMELRKPNFGIDCVAWSPTENLIAVATSFYHIRVVDADTGQVVALIPEPRETNSVSWSPDGQFVAWAKRNRVNIWSMKQRRVETSIPIASGSQSIDWSPNGRLIAVGTGNKGILLYNATTGEQTDAPGSEPLSVVSLSWSPDGRHIAWLSRDNNVRISDVSTGKSEQVFPDAAQPWSGRGKPISWHPRNKWITYATSHDSVRVMDMEGNSVLTIPNIPGVSVLDWNQAGDRLAIGDKSRLFLYDYQSKMVQTTGIGRGRPLSVDWSHDDQFVVTGTFLRSVRTLNSETGMVNTIFDDWNHYFMHCDWSRDGAFLATGYMNTLEIRDSTTSKTLRRMSHPSIIERLRWSPDGGFLATLGRDAVIRVWDTETWEIFMTSDPGVVYPYYEHVVDAHLTWGPGSRRIIQLQEKSVRVLSISNDIQLDLPVRDVQSVDWSPTDEWIAIGCADHLVRLFSPVDGSIGPVLRGQTAPVGVVSFGPDGKSVYSLGSDFNLVKKSDPTLCVWQLPEVQPSLSTKLDHGPQSAAFTLDATRLALNDGHVIRFYDTSDGTKLFEIGTRYLGFGAGLFTTFSPDGTRLSDSKGVQTTNVWSVNNGRLLWRTLLCPDSESVTINPAGEWLDASPNSEEHIIYMIESDDASLDLMSRSRFSELPGVRSLGGNSPSITKQSTAEPKKSAIVPDRESEPWISLLDAQSIDGWRSLDERAEWKIENGEVVGSGASSLLFFEREQFDDFELKAECNITKEGNSGIFIRSDLKPIQSDNGYEIQIGNSSGYQRTGSIWNRKVFERQLVEDNTWFKIHVTARGNHIVVRINGTITADFVDTNNLSSRGYIALQQHMSGERKGVTVRFRAIELRRLLK